MTAMTPAQVTPTREQMIAWLERATPAINKRNVEYAAILSFLRSQAAPSDARGEHKHLRVAMQSLAFHNALNGHRGIADGNPFNAEREAALEYLRTLAPDDGPVATPSVEPSKAVCTRCNNERIVRNSREEAKVVGEEWSECPSCQPPSPATTLVSALVDAGEAGELDDDAIDADNERMLAAPPSPATDCATCTEMLLPPAVCPDGPSPAAGESTDAREFAMRLLEAYPNVSYGFAKMLFVEAKLAGEKDAEHPHAAPGDV